MTDKDKSEELLVPAEVAALFRVDPKTVTRWAKAGRIPSLKTPGGHHRFRKDDVEELRQAGLGKSIAQQRQEQLERLVADISKKPHHDRP